MDVDYDVVIVGAGIAGLSAALYTARQKLKTLVISKDLGGQLNMTTLIENYPAIHKISGPELAKRVEQQARAFGAEVIFDEVNSIEKVGDIFVVKTWGGDEYKALAVILAFGKTPKELGVPGETKFKNRGVSYCTICDAPFFKGQDVALVSWGDLAREPATILSSIANKFYWIFPSEKPIHDDEFIEQIKRLGKAVFIPNSEVVEIRGDTKVRSIIIKNKKTGEIQEIPVAAIFIEAGYVTRSDFVKHLVDLNERGEIIADWEGKTKTPGVFAAGDIVAYPYKQAVISAAMGVAAALSATAYIMKLKGKTVYSLVDWRAEKK
ncbi:Thioredoxin-disulfide reductase [Pyrobaculum islandicum DSM 4184]|uniref:Thioredoxin-disulfide reductase n=1 Tax=Pyrobaculum islandicum (strain DSM 4184 / JCM 9189 / GEO3) TaxID=384616 RepID=A1RV73_PYRIL|nr:FAD-dependent oxidoreductase [Pyrobaculum islandicum]ABL88855.1 Thioredoxin-disulfide reductase [Pyrobaculum islandicum DSM 4184]